MNITFDPHKNQRNIDERGLPFTEAAHFDFSTALIAQDTRKDYGETRFVAVGFVRRRLHVLCFKPTTDGIRVISFRKANGRERKHYEQSQAAH